MSCGLLAPVLSACRPARSAGAAGHAHELVAATRGRATQRMQTGQRPGRPPIRFTDVAGTYGVQGGKQAVGKPPQPLQLPRSQVTQADPGPVLLSHWASVLQVMHSPPSSEEQKLAPPVVRLHSQVPPQLAVLFTQTSFAAVQLPTWCARQVLRSRGPRQRLEQHWSFRLQRLPTWRQV